MLSTAAANAIANRMVPTSSITVGAICNIDDALFGSGATIGANAVTGITATTATHEIKGKAASGPSRASTCWGRTPLLQGATEKKEITKRARRA